MMNGISFTLWLTALINTNTPTPFTSASTTDWITDLSPLLSPDTTINPTNSTTWIEECMTYFDQVYWVTNYGVPVEGVNNYWLFEQPGGLCMQTASCAFVGCHGPFVDVYGPFEWLYQSEALDPELPVVTREDLETFTKDERFNLQAVTVHPLHVGDVSASVLYAVENGIGVSVKTSGHNWMGASVKGGTLNINLSKLEKYALPELSAVAITECGDGSLSLTQAVGDACKLAFARGKKAVIRVGGGQIWDEPLRTLVQWNSQNTNQYHLMSGNAGTVSAAGGWLASGGLGGTTGHRLFGYGIDQLLHVEMVLPDGRHVRFGPSSWKTEEGNIYPLTETVSGYCNNDVTDEANWVWEECSEDTPFEDLWFAIRGGGGGQYGIVTSAYYQLHDKPGLYQEISWLDPLQETMANSNGTAVDAILRTWYEFLLKFLYRPEDLEVSKSVSVSCSAPDSGILVCYNNAATEFVAKWTNYSNSLFALSIKEATSHPENVLAVSSLDAFKDTPMYERILDAPVGLLNFVLDTNSLIIPIQVIVNSLDQFINAMMPQWLNPDLQSYEMYLYGGNTEFSSDGMDSLPISRRKGAFHIRVTDMDIITNLLKLVFNVTDTESYVGEGQFPGIFCHNHLFDNKRTPFKDNWLKLCDSDDDVAAGLCMTVQEAAFGSSYARLKEIHTMIDPLGLFDTYDGVGYVDSVSDEGDADTDEGDVPVDNEGGVDVIPSEEGDAVVPTADDGDADEPTADDGNADVPTADYGDVDVPPAHEEDVDVPSDDVEVDVETEDESSASTKLFFAVSIIASFLTIGILEA